MKLGKRMWALALSAALIVTQLPVVAMAEGAAPEDGSIASFEPLDSGVANQAVDVGTGLSELNLPDMVSATIYHVTKETGIPDEAEGGEPGGSTGDPSDQDSGETVTEITTTKEEIPVAWDSEPDYDGETEGSYLFTADVGGYALSAGAELPQITVTVAGDTVEEPAGDSEKEPPSCTKAGGCTLADGHEGGCNTGTGIVTVTAFDGLDGAVRLQTVPAGTAEEDLALPATLNASGYQENGAEGFMGGGILEHDPEPSPEQITIDGVTWEPDSPWDETVEQGNYIFTPVLPAGYALADKVELPEINVRVSAGNMLPAALQDDYQTDDEDAFKVILEAHPSLKSISGVDAGVPASWETAGLVRWDTSSPKRLYKLSLYDKGLTGTLDVSSLAGLAELDCSDNQLTALVGLDKLTNLTTLSCGGNPYTSFTTTAGYTLAVTQPDHGKVVTTDYDKNNQQFTMTATPDSGYVFETWTNLPNGANVNDNPVTFTLNSNLTVTAVFKAAPDQSGDGYTFVGVDGKLTITSSTGTTAWRNNPKINKNDVKSVVLESSVTSIGDFAFYGCEKLEEMDMSACTSLGSIGNSAFYGCASLTKAKAAVKRDLHRGLCV